MGFSPILSLLMPAFSLPYSPDVLTVILQPSRERSSTAQDIDPVPVVSVIGLSPVTFSAQNHLTSKLLRTF